MTSPQIEKNPLIPSTPHENRRIEKSPVHVWASDKPAVYQSDCCDSALSCAELLPNQAELLTMTTPHMASNLELEERLQDGSKMKTCLSTRNKLCEMNGLMLLLCMKNNMGSVTSAKLHPYSQVHPI